MTRKISTVLILAALLGCTVLVASPSAWAMTALG